MSLRLSRDSDGLPTRRARSGEQDEGLPYREVDPWDRYSIGLRDFGKKLGLGQYEGQVLIEELKLKEDSDAYRVEKSKRGNIQRQGLSPKALEAARAALADPKFDIEGAKTLYRESDGERRRSDSRRA